MQKLVDNVGPEKALASNNLKSSYVTIIDENVNNIQRCVLVDDQDNIIN